MKFFSNINLNRLKEGLSKTRDKLVTKITETFSGKAVIDDNTLNELEEILISSDLSSELAEKIINNLRINLKDEKNRTLSNIIELLKDELLKILNTEKTNISSDDLKLSVTVDKAVPESIIGDPFRLRQVITNLLNHSVKNTERGEIQLKC